MARLAYGAMVRAPWLFPTSACGTFLEIPLFSSTLEFVGTTLKQTGHTLKLLRHTFTNNGHAATFYGVTLKFHGSTLKLFDHTRTFYRVTLAHYRENDLESGPVKRPSGGREQGGHPRGLHLSSRNERCCSRRSKETPAAHHRALPHVNKRGCRRPPVMRRLHCRADSGR